MRIAYVTMQFPRPSETFAASDIRALVRRGHVVDVFCLRPEHISAEQLAEQQDSASIRVTSLTGYRYLSGVLGLLADPIKAVSWFAWVVTQTWRRPYELARSVALMPMAYFIFRKIAAAKPDVVHLFWGHYPALVGHLVRLHCPDTLLTIFLGAYDLHRGLHYSFSLGRRADIVFTHAKVNRAILEGHGVPSERIHVVYRGVDIEQSLSVTSCPRTAGRIVAVGNLIPEKAVRLVIDAFALVRQHVPTAELVIIGDGPERERLERRVAGHALGSAVRFLGHLPHRCVLTELRRSSVLLYLSQKSSDRLPNVIKEAMLAGCIPVVSRTPGIEELVTDNVTGFVVEAADIIGAASIVVNVLTTNDVEAMRVCARDAILTQFDNARTMQQYEAAWSNSRNRAPGRR